MKQNNETIGSLTINLEVKQTLLSKFVVNLAMFLDDYRLIKKCETINLMDYGYHGMKSFKFRINKGKWNRFIP